MRREPVPAAPADSPSPHGQKQGIGRVEVVHEFSETVGGGCAAAKKLLIAFTGRFSEGDFRQESSGKGANGSGHNGGPIVTRIESYSSGQSSGGPSRGVVAVLDEPVGQQVGRGNCETIDFGVTLVCTPR